MEERSEGHGEQSRKKEGGKPSDATQTAYLMEEEWAAGVWNESNQLYKSAAWSYVRVVRYLTSPVFEHMLVDFPLSQEIDFLAVRLDRIGELDMETFRAAVESALTRNYWAETDINCLTCNLEGDCELMLDDSFEEFTICARYEVDDIGRARQSGMFRHLARKIATCLGIDLKRVLTAFAHIDKVSSNSLRFFLSGGNEA